MESSFEVLVVEHGPVGAKTGGLTSQVKFLKPDELQF